ncbi:MAG: transposase [Rhodobacter sp.]|nr:transposase [Rhodobacter sp.]
MQSNLPRGAMLKEQEAGMPSAEVCRKHGVSTATFYR